MELRTLCSFIALTVPVGEGKENPLLTAALELHLGEGTEMPEQAVERQSPTEPPAGSLEKFGAVFGNVMGGQR